MLKINYPFDWPLMITGLYMGLHLSNLVYYYIIVKLFNMDQNDFNMFKSIDKQFEDIMGDYKNPMAQRLMLLLLVLHFSGCLFLSLLFPVGLSMLVRIIAYMFVFVVIFVIVLLTFLRRH